MTFKLDFVPKALKEFKKLDQPVVVQLKKKLSERLKNPCVPKDRLHHSVNLYKIKLRDVGIRLVYEVDTSSKVICVLAVGKRDKNEVYFEALMRNSITHKYDA